MIAPPILETIEKIVVVRDDLLPGGTKSRVILQLLTGASEFVYASPGALFWNVTA